MADPPADPPKDPPADPKDPSKDPPKDPPKKNEFQERIDDLVTKNKEKDQKLKEFEDAEKTRKETELKTKGEFEKLAEDRLTELTSEKTARETAEARAKKFEDQAEKQIKAQLDAIKDDGKKKSAEALLAGLSIEDQYAKLPELLMLVGQPANAFGGPLPGGEGAAKASDEQKKARHAVLLTKKASKEGLTPPEKAEENRLATELSKDWKPAAPQAS